MTFANAESDLLMAHASFRRCPLACDTRAFSVRGCYTPQWPRAYLRVSLPLRASQINEIDFALLAECATLIGLLSREIDREHRVTTRGGRIHLSRAGPKREREARTATLQQSHTCVAATVRALPPKSRKRCTSS